MIHLAIGGDSARDVHGDVLRARLVGNGNIVVFLNAASCQQFDDLVRGVTGLSCRQNIVTEVVEEDERVGIRVIVGIGRICDTLGSLHL